MRQDFDVRGGPLIAPRSLPKLRAAMADMGLDGFYIPHEDEYQNEYLPDANERLAWATGFTGSAGAAWIFRDRAVLFVDGRYTLQAGDQAPDHLFSYVPTPDPGPAGWLSGETLTGLTLGYDAKLVTPNEAQRLEDAARRAGATLRAVAANPIDVAWTDRPPQPVTPIVPHPNDKAGRSSADKRNEIAATLTARDADAAVITAPASIAWLFNIRGGDVARSPLPLSRAIVRNDGTAALYLNPDKVSDRLLAHLGNEVAVMPETELADGLKGLSGQAVSIDPDTASAWFFDQLTEAGATLVRSADPVLLPKACKNETEIAGTRAAHIRDGVAVTRFLHWLDTDAQSGGVTEIDAAQTLEGFREELGGVEDLSFDTISGAGPNGALPHYRVSSASNRALEAGSLYLVDSGAQYLDGTTDVTRTVVIGRPTDEMRRHYTLVLKGHIAFARVRFPEGTTGTHLDTLARHALWQAGLDYDHGTGHGVGVYLGVHEGPQRIAKAWNSVPLQPGMIVSNEPGYYREGAYGIRIENLQVVTPASDIAGGERPMLGFETLTFAPLARALIDTALLRGEERDWVDAYHRDVLAKVGAALPDELSGWLGEACAPIGP
ncbi:MAG: aminopeptidase P family protein [Pseudomonadota bacterium]